MNEDTAPPSHELPLASPAPGDIGPTRQLRTSEPLYGGDVSTVEDSALHFPFVLAGETLQVDAEDRLVSIVEAAPERVDPLCPHFGACGGCHYQMMSAAEQLKSKRKILSRLMRDAGVHASDDIPTLSAEPYGYRNRIRLRVETHGNQLRFGYNRRGTREFLPIHTCPIAAPLLWSTAETILDAARDSVALADWLQAASEVEIFCDDAMQRVQFTLFCAPRTRLPVQTFTAAIQALQTRAPQLAGAGAIASDPRTGPTGRVLAEAGAPGLLYRVGDERYWVTRGGFFQVNRFLLDTLVRTVCDGRRGTLAWDLFAGVGLFSRVLARTFTQVAAVEGNPTAAADLRAALANIGPQHRAVQSSTLDFLRGAVTQRERPDLLVLDPPRAGAGTEACGLIARLRIPEIVYVSCDPTTLARDLHELQLAGYKLESLTLIDLFPQTFHIESIATLRLSPPAV